MLDLTPILLAGPAVALPAFLLFAFALGSFLRWCDRLEIRRHQKRRHR